jgi:hypothetical protein
MAVSLTEVERVFGGVHEDALNDVIKAFCTARPRYLHYGSPGFVPATTVAATAMPAIAFPGIAGGIDWSVAFTIPVVDLHPQTSGLPPELGLTPGRLSVRTAVQICIDCKHRLRPPRDPQKSEDRKDEERPHPVEGEVCAFLEVFGLGHLEVMNTGAGGGSIRVRIDAVELVDVTPDGLEAVLECLIRMLLDAALSGVVLPLQALRAGAFTLTLQRGPEIEDDQIKVYGDV